MAAIDPWTAGRLFLTGDRRGPTRSMSCSPRRWWRARRVPAATWSSVWYVLSSYAVISLYRKTGCMWRSPRVGFMARRFRLHHLPAPAAGRSSGRGALAGNNSGFSPRRRDRCAVTAR